ncbi:MAG TPA: glycosyltransferase family 4 protein [Armatimonadetes bacterium]|nr:glycosyltransferase family 4 protein [Armatimonadota bacterium]
MAERSTGASGPRAQEPLRLGCIFEQAIGHITFRANLEAQMRAWPDVAPEWHLLPYESAGRWPPRRLNWTLRSGLMARSALRGRSYDVLLFHTHLPALLCLDHLRRMPTLLSMDATPAQNARLGIYVGGAQRRALMRHLAGDWTVRALRRAHRIIAWSRWVQQSLITEYGVDPARVDVLAPGVNVALWEGRFRAGRELGGRGKAGPPARVLFVGGDLRAKGGEILLEAFRRSWRGRAELHLVTRTPVPRELGVYTYAGLTPNSPGLVRLFGAADLFVLPTLGDTFAQVVLEAMASGLPVVASRVGAIPELVVDGETGFLVPPGDADALAQAVNTLLEESRLRERMGRAGWQRAREEFDIARNGRRLVELALRAREEAR